MKMRIDQLMRVPTEQHDVQWLKDALQAAIELEHSTIPPYLCALWSIKDSDTQHDRSQFDGVRARIRAIVMDEMYHMGLACNMLTAIGGNPRINEPGFVPSYPGPLPGGVRPELTVRLEGLTKNLVRDVFMQIEFPEGGPIVAAALETYPTLGAFYDAVLDAFEELERRGEIHIDGTRLQQKFGRKLYPIQSIDDVRRAIKTIKLEGEGTNQTPEASLGNLAHYYKFSEMDRGATYEQLDGKWQYNDNKPVVFPEMPTDVYPMAVVPEGGYGEVSAEFDGAYTKLLDELHDAWNKVGVPIRDAISTMYSLGGLAAALMRKPLPDGSGRNYGPGFAYVKPASSRHDSQAP